MSVAVPLAVAGTVVLGIRTGNQHLTNLVTATNLLYEHGLAVQDWHDACVRAEAAAMRSGPVVVTRPPSEIAARSVTFSYPNSAKPALRNVDMTVGRGEIVALVGEHGSGKTTLARLLVGLYLPSEGSVTWDGQPIPGLDRASVLDRVALVSQDFVQWPFTARVNVTIGRPTDPRAWSRLAAAARFGRADDVVDSLDQGWE